jgi:hypothetical protein
MGGETLDPLVLPEPPAETAAQPDATEAEPSA